MMKKPAVGLAGPQSPCALISQSKSGSPWLSWYISGKFFRVANFGGAEASAHFLSIRRNLTFGFRVNASFSGYTESIPLRDAHDGNAAKGAIAISPRRA
jgi:hypothetical protein